MKEIKALNITVTKRYTTVNGNIIDKNTIPSDLQKKVPFFIWGKFDSDGAFSRALNDTFPDPNLKYFNTFLAGSNDFLAFTGANEIKELVDVGDILQVYTDDIQNPSYFIWISISGSGQPYGSILANVDGSMMCEYVLYNSENILNYDQPIRILHLSQLGDKLADSFSPEQGNSPYNRTDTIKNIRLDLAFKVTPYIGFNSYMLFESDVVTFNFMLNVPNYG